MEEDAVNRTDLYI